MGVEVNDDHVPIDDVEGPSLMVKVSYVFKVIKYDTVAKFLASYQRITKGNGTQHLTV